MHLPGPGSLIGRLPCSLRMGAVITLPAGLRYYLCHLADGVEDRFTLGRNSKVPGVRVWWSGVLGITAAQEGLMLNVAVLGRSWCAAGRNGLVRVVECPHGLPGLLTFMGSSPGWLCSSVSLSEPKMMCVGLSSG